MKKALVILYYWPPAGGSAVQRWLTFTRYMKENGWQAIVYAPENATYPETDPGLVEKISPEVRVIRHPIREPYQIFSFLSPGNKKQGVKAGMTFSTKPSGWGKTIAGAAMWVRGNFFIPDARKWWIGPSVRFLKAFLDREKADLIITSGPPHSLHLIGLKLKRLTGVPWVADFRDPWTGIDFYEDLHLTRLADKKHRELERSVLKAADHIIVVGQQMKETFLRGGAARVDVVTNGYDEETLSEDLTVLDQEFSMFHAGTIPRSRNCETLWQALGELAREREDLRKDLVIRLTGNIDYSVRQSIALAGLEVYLQHKAYLPHHEVIRQQRRSQVLLLLLNDTPQSKGIVTGKLFEYLSARRPVLLIGPEDGDAAAILKETSAGQVAAFGDKESIKRLLEAYYIKYRAGRLEAATTGIEAYSRKNLARKVCSVLDSVVA